MAYSLMQQPNSNHSSLHSYLAICTLMVVTREHTLYIFSQQCSFSLLNGVVVVSRSEPFQSGGQREGEYGTTVCSVQGP